MMGIQPQQKIGIIGHDIIGSIRGIELYENFGLTPTLVLDNQIPENPDVIAVTAMSKIATPKTAYLRTRKAISRCRSRYLVFHENMYLMGNISANIKAIIDEMQPEKLVVCTSWVEMNCFTRGAYAYLGNVKVSESIKALDAVTPIKESYLPAIVKKYTGLTPKCISLADVERGSDTIRKIIQKCTEKIIICDATTSRHLKNVAEAIVSNKPSWVACGSGGLTRAMVPLLSVQKQKQVCTTISNKKPALLVLGSMSDVAAVQLTTAAERGMLYPVLVEPSDFWHREERKNKTGKIASEVGRQIVKGNNVALTSTYSRFIPQFKKITANLLSSIARLVIEENEIGGIFLKGADTAYAFCKTMDIYKLETKGSIAEELSPMVVKGYTQKGTMHWLCLLGGSSGDEMTLVNALKFLRQN